MSVYDIADRRFARLILPNAELEELASGFRWLEGLVWMGDADCLLFQDLPRNRTMRWIQDAGVSVYRSPSDYGLAFSPDEKRLYVAETGDQTIDAPRQSIRVFDVVDDGLRLTDGVHCIDPQGGLLGKIRIPHRVSNLVFGGPSRNRLFIGGSQTLYAIFVNTRGSSWP